MDEITFIEMFCGIGGFRLGLERASGPSQRYRCVFANDIDRYACRVYRKHWDDGTLVEGDVRSIEPDSLPHFDLLTAGFPCQPFSLAGRREGTADPRGTLFWEILRFVHAKRPAVVLLENVKGLLSIEKGRTFADILHSLGDVGYLVEWQVLNSKYHGVPQHRERLFIIGHLGGVPSRTIFPLQENGRLPRKAQGTPPREGARLRSDDPPPVARTLLERYHKDGSDNLIQVPQLGGDGGSCGDMSDISRQVAQAGAHGQASSKMSHSIRRVPQDEVGGRASWEMSDILRQVGQIEKLGQAGRVYDPTGPAKTLLGTAGGEGAKTGFYAIYADHGAGNIKDRLKEAGEATAWGLGGVRTEIAEVPNCRIRRLTPVECERLQGFPDGWTDGVSDTQRYKLLGNAVTVNVIELLGRKLLEWS